MSLLALYMFGLGRYLDQFMKDGRKDAFTWCNVKLGHALQMPFNHLRL